MLTIMREKEGCLYLVTLHVHSIHYKKTFKNENSHSFTYSYPYNVV